MAPDVKQKRRKKDALFKLNEGGFFAPPVQKETLLFFVLLSLSFTTPGVFFSPFFSFVPPPFGPGLAIKLEEEEKDHWIKGNFFFYPEEGNKEKGGREKGDTPLIKSGGTFGVGVE